MKSFIKIKKSSCFTTKGLKNKDSLNYIKLMSNMNRYIRLQLILINSL